MKKIINLTFREKKNNLTLHKKGTQKGNTKRLPSVNNTPMSTTYRDALYLKRKVLDIRFTDEIKCP